MASSMSHTHPSCLGAAGGHDLATSSSPPHRRPSIGRGRAAEPHVAARAADYVGVSTRMLDSRFPARSASPPDGQAPPGGAAGALDGLTDLVGQPTVGAALRTARETLGMEVAYTSELVGDDWSCASCRATASRSGSRRTDRAPRGDLLPAHARWADCEPDPRRSVPTTGPRRCRSRDRRARRRVRDGAGDALRRPAVRDAVRDQPRTKSFDYSDLQFLLVLARLVADQLAREETATASNELPRLSMPLTTRSWA